MAPFELLELKLIVKIRFHDVCLCSLWLRDVIRRNSLHFCSRRVFISVMIPICFSLCLNNVLFVTGHVY